MKLLYVMLLLQGAFCLDTHELSLGYAKQCRELCKDIKLGYDQDLFPPLDEVSKKIACLRGCWFFSLNKNDTNIDGVKENCYTDCDETYNEEKSIAEYIICKRGCDAVASEKVAELSVVVVFSDEESHRIIYGVNDLEVSDSDLSDPSIKSQFEVDSNSEYKIPETRIQTMPIEISEKDTTTTSDNGDWLDCAARNSGVPRWILLSAILVAVLVALWLSLSTEKKAAEEENAEVARSDEKLILKDEYIVDYDESLMISKDIEVLPQTKYSLENEKV